MHHESERGTGPTGRAARAEDAQTLKGLNAEPSTRTWLPSHVYSTAAEAAGRVGFLINQYADPGDPTCGPYVLGVEHLQTGQLLGHVSFSPLDDEVEISYAIAQTWRGRGLGTEAIVAACAWVAAVFGLTRILGLTASANVASRRGLARAGFVHIGDEVRRFQGREQSISTYVCPPA